jgi:hypothetical protein
MSHEPPFGAARCRSSRLDRGRFRQPTAGSGACADQSGTPGWHSRRALAQPVPGRAAGRLVAARSLCSCPPAPLPPSWAPVLLRNHRTLEVLSRRCGREATGVVQECAREGTPPSRPAREGMRSGRR